MEPGDRRPARTALLKAAAASLGAAFFILAIARPAPWAYAIGALLLAGSVVVGRRPRP
ncbi:hypothetical protein [Kitasatospora sp. NPDC098663]|uniref:hypothetical protein n=1 Tax=Kitasatospora sp. NPDC098663 TaxID=3364096 RepID=UPI0037F9F562